jgi:hypothetical protein
MDGEPMAVAVEATKEWLRRLPQAATFNIVSFGSRFEYLFSEVVPASRRDEAIAKVSHFTANFGGTEIQAPLRSLFMLPLSGGNTYRNVFLLTDGAVYDERGVVQLVTAFSHENRMFVYGIGAGASPFLVVQAAKAGNGRHYFLHRDAANSYLIEAMLDTMHFAQRTAYRSLTFSLEQSDDVVVRPELPLRGPPSLAGEISTHLRLLTVFPSVESFCSRHRALQLELSEAVSGRRIYLRLPAASCRNQSLLQEIPEAGGLFQQAALEAISELQERREGSTNAEEVRSTTQQIVNTSLKYRVICSQTALIAIGSDQDRDARGNRKLARVSTVRPRQIHAATIHLVSSSSCCGIIVTVWHHAAAIFIIFLLSVLT